MLAASQREQSLKFEILVQIAGPEPTAVASFNYHQDHFAHAFGIEMAAGGEAHTACLGFGEERIVLEHITRMGEHSAPDWPRHPSPLGGYRVILDGMPTYTVDIPPSPRTPSISHRPTLVPIRFGSMTLAPIDCPPDRR